MSVQIVLDITNEYTTGSQSGQVRRVKLDVGGYDYFIAQIINSTDSIGFYSTNDSGDIQGVSDGSAVSADNWVSIQGIDLSTGTAVGSASSPGGLYRFEGIGRYIYFDGSSADSDVEKFLIRLYKIK
jgi:hypothetical protein